VTNQFQIKDVPDVGPMLFWMAKKLRLSLSALTSSGGTASSSLNSFATGSKTQTDLNLRPLLRILKAVNYELVASPKGKAQGLLLRRDGAEDLLVVGSDGGRLEIVLDVMEGLPAFLNTMAAATGQTVTAMVRAANCNSLTLVGIATGRGTHSDVRIRALLKTIDIAGFDMHCRPVHATRRAARAALADARRD
jgi:hypothetical protein